MKILMMISLIILIVSNIMMFISIILSKKSNMDREKCSPFECGFDPKSSARIPFSMHFFLITVIFLIFDVEISLIFPMISTFKLTELIQWLKVSFFFIIILMMGIFHEWNQNMLNWTN